MHETKVIAVVGSCAPERARYTEQLARAADGMHVSARRLSLAPDPLDEACALAPWANTPAGAVAEFPTTTIMTELIGALADPAAHLDLTAIVCVVDAAHLLRDLARDDYAHHRAAPWQRDAGIRYTARAMLAVTQIEYASMVVLVNWEALSTPDLSTTMALVSSLSPQARLRLDHDGVAAPEATESYASTQERPGWVALLNGDFNPHMTDRRITGLRYEHLRPLHPERLQTLLDDRIEQGEFGTVLRSAGFCHFATRPGIVGEWNHVGSMISFEPLALAARHHDADEVLAIGQDLAIIGLDLDVTALTAALDDAALTDDEFATGPEAWAKFPDPYPAWDTADAETD